MIIWQTERKKSMPKYKIVLSKTAQKQLDKFDDSIANPLLKAISALAEQPRPTGYKKLKNRNGLRIRVGNYRIIYEIYDNILTIDVIAIGHRKEIYD
jgi:mRNA interferase RelE/StbE